MPVRATRWARDGWTLLALISGQTAWAGAGISGTSVPGAGGGFAGPTEPGALGAPSNPAAVALGEAPELLIDGAAFRRVITIALDDWDGPERQVSWAPQPSAAAAAAFGKLGVGAVFQAPYARGGPQPPDGPQRFFTVDSTLQLLEGQILAAVRPIDGPPVRLSIGAGLCIGQLTYMSEKHVDTGATFNTVFDLDPPLPVGDPLLEGRQRAGAMSGWGLSWTAGASVELPAHVALDVAFQPRWRIWASGPVEQEPSIDLDALITGDGRARIAFPAHLLFGARVPVGPLTVIGDVEWVGWSGASTATSEISGLTVTSSDPLFDAILVGSGLAEADFLASNEGTDETALGLHDVVIPGLQVQVAPIERLELRAGGWYAPAAFSDASVTPSSLDYGTVTARVAGGLQIVPQLRTALSIDHMFGLTRHITTSPYSFDAPTADGALAQSGNGTYALDVWRFGLSVQVFAR